MNFAHENLVSLASLSPELSLCFGILAIFLFDLLAKPSREFQIIFSLIILIIVSLVLIIQFGEDERKILFNDLLVLDNYSVFFKIFFVVTTFFTILIVIKSQEFESAGITEIIMFLLTITLGMMLLSSSVDLLMIYLSLETISLLSYVLVGYKIDSKPSSEASLKYIVFGGVSSGIMLFGISYLYGMFGTTNLFAMKDLLSISDPSVFSYPVLFAVILIMVGFGFKVVMVPFHMWCPDVYEGAPTPITAFLSVGSKAAGFAILIRFLFTLFGGVGEKFYEIFEIIKIPQLIIILSIITMTVGNLAAIHQNNLKRLLAYSSIAHAGYILMGFAAFNREGLEAILFYFPIYLFMNIGAFLVVIAVRDSTGSEDISAFRDLGKRNPFLAFSMAVFLFSLTGLPPLAGFLGKFYLFAAVINKGLYILATIGVINSVISLFYYARIIRAMFLEEIPASGAKKLKSTMITICNLYNILTLLFLLGNLLLIFYWSPLLKIVKNSALMNF